MRDVNATLLVLAAAVRGPGLLTDEDDVAVLPSHHVTGLDRHIGLAAHGEDDHEDHAEDEEAAADANPGHDVLLVREESLQRTGPGSDTEADGGVEEVKEVASVWVQLVGVAHQSPPVV